MIWFQLTLLLIDCLLLKHEYDLSIGLYFIIYYSCFYSIFYIPNIKYQISSSSVYSFYFPVCLICRSISTLGCQILIHLCITHVANGRIPLLIQLTVRDSDFSHNFPDKFITPINNRIYSIKMRISFILVTCINMC